MFIESSTDQSRTHFGNKRDRLNSILNIDILFKPFKINIEQSPTLPVLDHLFDKVSGELIET